MQEHLKKSLYVAPMMGKTDSHFRYLARLISKQVHLYSEMITTGAILYGDAEKILSYNQEENPLSLQLGGSDPIALKDCVLIAKEKKYDEVNLNVGCPSNRVQKGNFGACLMEQPKVVAECVKMMSGLGIPITVKCRIGTDILNSYGDLSNFIKIVSDQGGCETFIIHARIANLNGFTPKQNREIPPLKYYLVHDIKKEFPKNKIIINGGIDSIEGIRQQLNHVDGVMVGRSAYSNPWLLSEFDNIISVGSNQAKTRYDVSLLYLDYVKKKHEEGVSLYKTMRHLLGLYRGIKGGKKMRRYISENISNPNIAKYMFSDIQNFF